MSIISKPNTFSPNTIISSSEVNSNFDTLYNDYNGNVSSANLATDAVTTAKIANSAVTADKIANGAVTSSKLANADGWNPDLPAPNTVTNNGNRSYDLVFNGTDLTDTVSEGMRLRTTRTVSAPTQCADLESGNSQYFSKTSPAGISFTTTFTCSAWVKLESYGATSGIIARRNASTEGWSLRINTNGQIELSGLRIASNNKSLQSYQSVPLNKWVHVAACLDMTVGDTPAQRIWIDGVEVPRSYIPTGTATAIVQGTTALVVGAADSAGSSPFDGKIAQASVHSACLSDAQVKALMTQTISSSSPSIVSGFTLNNTLADVTANANDLTAQGSALATNVDSPFGSYLGGTLEYGIITKTAFSTNTTLTVQVPEGCTIPTSGGVSAVAYSTQSVPYLFPDTLRFMVSTYENTQMYLAAKWIPEIMQNIPYVNPATAGGTFYMSQTGKVRKIYGITSAALATSTTPATQALTMPTGFLTTLHKASAGLYLPTSVATQYSNMNNASTSTISVYLATTTGTGTAKSFIEAEGI